MKKRNGRHKANPDSDPILLRVCSSVSDRCSVQALAVLVHYFKHSVPFKTMVKLLFIAPHEGKAEF